MTQGCFKMFVFNRMNEISDIILPSHLFCSSLLLYPKGWHDSTCEFKVLGTSREVHIYSQLVPMR